jgi:putative transposase
MVSFIDTHRERHGIEPICAVLPIAPSTYHAHKALQAHPERRCPRARRDDVLRERIRGAWEENFEVYGVRKVWRELKRRHREEPVARCTMAWLMGEMGLQGAVRGRKFVRTTIADEAALRPQDLVTRQFKATAPNQLSVADLERHEALSNRA